jgi:putative ABC transport system substrate-binding protein
MTDPVGLHLIASEARPGTNVTGTLIRVEGLAAKLLDIARDLKPSVHRFGVLANANNPSNVVQRREIEAAATRLGVGLSVVEVRTVGELGPAFQTFVHEGADIVIVFTGAVLINARREVAKLALASRLPTICGREDFVESGALVSYGINQRETYHRAAYYVDKILKGEEPAILPVEFSTTLELVINVGTAKAIGLDIPSTMLARADEVIR